MEDRKAAGKMISSMAKESLKANRMRNIFVMTAIVLVAALLSAILMFASGQRQKTENELSHRQQVVYVNLTRQQMEALKREERMSYQIQGKSGVLTELDGYDVMPHYVSELSDQIRAGELESGKMPRTKQEIAVPKALLLKMGVSPEAGSQVTIPFYDGNTESFTVSGILRGSEEAKQFTVFFSEDYAEGGSQLKDAPYEVYGKILDAEHMSAGECKEMMYAIGRDAGVERKNVSPSKAFLDSRSVNMSSVILYGLVGFVILLAGVLVVYGVFYLSVIGRIHQFGQLRTIGMTKKQIRKFVSREGRMLFFHSAPIGIAAGTAAGYFMIPEGFHPWNTLGVIALVFAAAYVITMASIRKPARIAAAVSPMEALRYVPQDGRKQAASQKICRSLTPLGLGRMNFFRNQKKTVLTMLSLGLGGVLFMTAATYLSSYDKDKFARQGYFTDAEFNICYAASAIELNEYGISGMQAREPMDEGMVQEISSWDGVRGVREIKGFGLKFDYPKEDEYGTDDYVMPVTEEEAREIGAYLEEGSADYSKWMTGDYVLVLDNPLVEEIYGWKFKPGEKLVFHYYDGGKTAEKEVTVLGSLSRQYTLDHKGSEGWFLMPEQAVLKWRSFGSLNSNLLVSTDPEKEAAVSEKLEELVGEKPGLSLETLAERRIIYKQNADQLFGAISGLAIFIMMFSILSMMNTLITNIVTRRQELAMLESIGMGKGQIRSMILNESMLLVFITLGVTMTFGTLCGYVLSHLLYKNGAFYMAFRFPAAAAFAYGAVLILVPLFIAAVTLKSFSKEPLVERLRSAEN
ncbi:MAG: ABC transporter permease [Lachnospiraceae bacterium]|nr:ABC transporter permease [Lachnospiraceae bacterium]